MPVTCVSQNLFEKVADQVGDVGDFDYFDTLMGTPRGFAAWNVAICGIASR